MTVTQLISEFKGEGFYPGCPSATALVLFNRALKELGTRCELRNSVQYVNLVAGQREYAIDANQVTVYAAYLEKSSDSSNWIVLTETSVAKLDELSRGWRMVNGGYGAYQYYITSAADGDASKPMIGFHPAPDATTSGTYPRVALYSSVHHDLDGADNLPSNVLSEDVFLYRMAYRWSVRRDPDKAAYWQTLSEKEMTANVLYVKNQQAHGQDSQFVTQYQRNASRVV